MKKYSYSGSKINKKADSFLKKIRKFEWKHHNLIFLVVSIVIAYYILRFKPVLSFIHGLSYLGYFAAFILGMMFTYALTVVPATAVLYNLGQQLNPLLIAFIGAFGSVISDYLIFRFVRDKLINEIKLLSKEINHLTKPVSDLVFTEEITVILWKKISRSRIWKHLIPIIAGFIIASPLPDELGVAIFGAAKYEPKKFLLFSYCLNFVGILAITSLGKIL
jgi:uncharacterized membrane protein YdjX (TVP38/TMEM64 family)